MTDQNLPPLPPKIAEQMRALRQVEPSGELVDKAFERAASAAGARERGAKPAPPSLSRAKLTALFAVPALVIAAVTVYFIEPKEKVASAIERSEERSLELPQQGHVWTDLDLQTQHHADEPAVVHVEIPESVRVALPNSDGGALERHCEAPRGCVHRFTQKHGHHPPLRVAVAHPGRYEIHVRHESQGASVRERFVLTAQRD